MTDVPTLVTATERWVQEHEHELWPDRPRTFFNHTNCRVCGPGPLKRGRLPFDHNQVCYSVQLVQHCDDYGYRWKREETRPCPPSKATTISSQIEGTNDHIVMLDIDMPTRAIESSTAGHAHLYIDHRLPWRKYKRLLKALRRAGLIENGFYQASVRRKATHLRPPWRDKETQ